MNEVGNESGNALMVEGRTLPLLQDTSPSQAWGPWAVTYRDVIIVDGQGLRRDVYNVTLHDLSKPEHSAALKAKLLAARGP